MAPTRALPATEGVPWWNRLASSRPGTGATVSLLPKMGAFELRYCSEPKPAVSSTSHPSIKRRHPIICESKEGEGESPDEVLPRRLIPNAPETRGPLPDPLPPCPMPPANH